MRLTRALRFSQNMKALASFILGTAVALCGGCAFAPVGSGPHLTATEQMMWSTYPLATPRGMASCVLVNRHDPSAPNGVVPLLITAAHVVASAPQGPFYLFVRQPQANKNPAVAVLELTSMINGDSAFFAHPDADIAVLELRIPPQLATEISLRSFVDERTIGRAKDDPRVGDELSILGFPKVFPGTEGAFPVLRSGKMASYSLTGRNDHEKFLINATAYPGDSGAPVFASDRRGGLHLVGLLTERIGARDQGVPLAIAINAADIRQTLDLQSDHARVYLGDETRTTKARTGTGIFLANQLRPESRKFLAKIAEPASP